MLLTVLGVTAATGAVATLIAGIVAGGQGALGGALGTVVAVAFFGIGLALLERVGRRWPELFLGAGLLVYMTQILVLVLLLRGFRDATFMNGRAFGIAVVACVLAWLVGQVWTHVRSRTPYVVPATGEPEPRG
ncbi:hypothetical protein [Streptomyces sp. NPDC052042]|uniref:hypothetical protein n=1 Tax=Streptomyces sp. NPDC052042 TaxID=3365683 RepID=UPI0037D547BD